MSGCHRNPDSAGINTISTSLNKSNKYQYTLFFTASLFNTNQFWHFSPNKRTLWFNINQCNFDLTRRNDKWVGTVALNNNLFTVILPMSYRNCVHTMVLILDGNSEHVPLASGKIGIFRGKNPISDDCSRSNQMP